MKSGVKAALFVAGLLTVTYVASRFSDQPQSKRAIDSSGLPSDFQLRPFTKDCYAKVRTKLARPDTADFPAFTAAGYLARTADGRVAMLNAPVKVKNALGIVDEVKFTCVSIPKSPYTVESFEVK